jgi:hypothetical protein
METSDSPTVEPVEPSEPLRHFSDEHLLGLGIKRDEIDAARAAITAPIEPVEPSPGPPSAPVSAPLDVEEYLTIVSLAEKKLRRAKTAEQFDLELAVTILCLQDRLADPTRTARVIAAFVRGVLEGAGCALPWNLTKRRGGPSAKRARARSSASRGSRRARRRS